MQDKKVKISNILGSLIPEFVHVDNPLFKDFLKQYYAVEEREYGSTNLADNLAEYKNISTLAEIETVRAQTINLEDTGTPESPIVVTAPVFAYDQKIYTIHNDGFPLTYGLLKIDDEIITYTGKNSNKVATQIYARHPIGQTKRDPVLIGSGTDSNPQYTNAFIVDNTLKRTTILLDTTVVDGLGPNQIAANNFAKIEPGMSFTATYQDDEGTELPVFPKGTFILATDATTGTIVVSDVPISTANLSYAPNHTISTASEEGIISTTVPIGILFNIIDNSFTGCARGFSGISKIETEGNPEELTFSKTNAAAHDLSAGVLNLNFEFLGQFYKKFKTNFLPGVENRKFATGLSIENILTRAKDFFISKGTDQSLDILFKVLFGKQVSVNKPWDNTISASDADWLTSDELIVDVISGNPMNLEFSTLYQGENSNFLTNSTASGAIENIEEIFLDDKRYYKIFLSKETVKSKFNIGSKTKVIKSEFNDLSTVTVDSTIGFGATGVFWYQDIDGVYQKAEYTSKSYNQFFGCVGVTTSREGQLIIGNEFVYAYEDNDITKPCQMRVLGTVSGVSDGIKNTKYSTKGDKISLKNLGEKTSESNLKFNSWIYNNVSETDIQEIETSSRTIELKTSHYLRKGDKIDIFEKYTKKPLDSKVEVSSVISSTKINYTGNGDQSSLKVAPISGNEYVIKKNINLVDSNLGTGILLADIQNTFVDKDKNTYVAFSGYSSAAIQTTDRSKTFTTSSVTTGSYQSPGTIQITNHGFITGEKVYYESISSQSGSGIKLGYVNQSGVLVNSGVTGITTGTYYVSKIDDNNIRLSISRHNIFSKNTLWDNLEYPIGIGTFSDSHKITPYSLWEGKSLQNQNNFKRILKTPEQKNEENDDIVGSIGVTLDGVELNSPITEDAIYYGQIDKCNVLNSGKDYDVINPPNVAVADTTGSAFEPILHLSDGYVDDLIVTSSGYDYRKVPVVTVSGGNGKGVVAEAKMKDLTQVVSFGDSLVSLGTTIGKIALDQEHRFLDGEEVIYTVSSDGHAIGIGSTNTTVGDPVPGAGSTSSLVNGGTYYVAKNSESNLSLAVTKQRAIDKKFLLDFVDDGSGTHTLTATRTRKILDRIVLRTNGEGFSNNRVEIDAQSYPPTRRRDIMPTFVGINTSDNYIFAKSHNFKEGDTIQYKTTGNAILGLSSEIDYKVSVVDKDRFRLSRGNYPTGRKNFLRGSNLTDLTLWEVQNGTGDVWEPATDGTLNPDGTPAWWYKPSNAAGGKYHRLNNYDFGGVYLDEYDTSYTVSVFAKRVTTGSVSNLNRYLELEVSGELDENLPPTGHTGTHAMSHVTFDLQDLTSQYAGNSAVNVNGLVGDPRIENYGNGWYRCSYVFNIGRSDSNSTLGTNSAPIGVWFGHPDGLEADDGGEVGNNNPSFYLWGAQIEKGQLKSPYIPTTTRAVTVDKGKDLLDYERKIYSYLSSIGSGTHTFNYSDISVSVEGATATGIGLTAGASLPNYYNASAYPVVKGKISNVFIKNGGVGYGVSTLINHVRKPELTIQNGEGEDGSVDCIIGSDGKISNAYVVNEGKNYTSPPILEVISTGDGNFGKLRANIVDGKLDSVDVLNPGNNYTQLTTSVKLTPAGIDGVIDVEIHKWKFNAVPRYDNVLSNPNYKETVQIPASLKTKGNKLVSFYATKNLRTILGDNIRENQEEAIAEDRKHSPIIGWAYDGNPIYGPYGNSLAVPDANGNFGGVRRMESSYKQVMLGNNNLRPIGVTTKIETVNLSGFFIEDFQYHEGHGDLDEYNGRYIINDDFPEGTYAYFCTIDTDTGSSKPIYPYTTIRHFNKTDNFNYDLLMDQSDEFVNNGSYKRNVTHLGLNDEYRRYSFLDEPEKSGTSIIVDSVKSAGLTTIFIDHPGDNYGVGDAVTFSDSDVVNGKIKDVFGKNIVSIASSLVSIDSLIFSVRNDVATAISTIPHAYKDGDVVQISGITSFAYSSLEGAKTIGVTTTITTNSVAIANTATTGISTFIQLKEPSWSNKFQVNDVIQIGNERMIILNKDNYNNRYRVARMHQGTSGSAHNVGLVVKKLPQEFTFPITNTANRDIIISKKFNFEGPSIPNQTTALDGAIGIGSTAQSRLVGYIGLSTITKTIPARSIYLPDHEFKTGDQLSYVSVGSTLKYSITDALTPQLDITGINTFFCIKWNKDFIGISTQKVGVSTAVGFTSTAVWFTAQTEGRDHRFETVATNITGQSEKIVGSVLLDVKHDLSLKDEINLNVSPQLTDVYDFRFDPEIRKLVVNPLGFASSAVSTGTNSTITIPNHKLNTGDVVYYKAANVIGGLSNKTKYHVIKISDNVIRLAKTKALLNKVPSENIVFSSVGSGNHELLRINPGIKVYRGNVVSIGVSNSSLDDYDINFYHDKEFKSKIDSTRIVKTGVFGDSDTNTKITINTDNSLPSTFYYKVSGKSDNFVNTLDLDHTDTDVVNYSSIELLDSKFNGLQRISGIGTTTFDFNMVGFAETTSYNTAGFSTALYTTNSTTAKGGINSIEINQLKLSENLTKIVGIGSTGSQALFSEETDDIGQIVGTLIENQGFGYSSDKTLTPSAEVYTVLKLKDVYTLESVGVETGGRNYTSRPNIIAIGNTSITLNAILDGNTVGGVEIINNDSGLSKNIKFAPTFNSNGIGVIGASSNFAVNQLKLKAPVVGFSTFPFAVGDKIWVENIRITDGMDGYNSSDYEYRFFTISAINTTGGNESISYPITGIGSTGGTFDTNNVFGRVIKEGDLAKFTPNLKTVNFVEGEKVSQINGNASGIVAKDGWDPVSQLLKLKDVTGNFEEGVKISSSLLESKSITQKVYNFDFDLTVDSIVNKSTTWGDDKGKLNSNHQKLHNNDYYQRFSYAIQGEVPFDSWKEPVTSLGHISGYKPFGDLEVLNGVGTTVGMGTFSGDISLEIKVESDAATYQRYYYDNVTESTNDPTYSKIIVFGGKVLTDYSESRTNKVLLIDDIANQFTGKNKTFTGIHTFISAGTNSVSVISGGSGGLTPDAGTEYDASTGVLKIVTASAHGLSNGATVSITDNSMIFRCNFDNYGSDHPYPRPSDPASTSNSRFNNGILSVGNTTTNSFTVTVNTPVIGGQNVGLSTFKLYTLDEKGVEPTGISTERLFLKTIQPSLGVNLTENEFSIANNEFNTGEPLIYSSNGFTRIGIDTTTISGVSTNFLPEEVYAIVSVNEGIREKTKFKLASSASNANSGIALTITSVGTGNTHTFAVPTELATNRSLITIDNVIQSPLTFKKNIPLQLSTAVGIGSTQVFLHNISRVSAGLIKIENELIKVEAVGVGSTNALNVFRGVMGSVAAAHTVGAAVTVVSGDYKIENGTIHFTDAPYGPTGIGSLTTRSSFSGRSFYRLKYDKNFIFDDLSEDFDGQEKDFYITSNGNTISGITTNYGFVLVNNIWQDPHHGEGGSSLNISDYQITGSGTSITFAGTYANNTYVASATKDLPQGGIINEFDINPGVGIQSAFTAIGIATVGAGGTIQSVSIGNSGSGYLYPPRVSVAITNYHYDHRFVSAAPNSVVSAGSTNYTPSYAHYTSKTGELMLTIDGHGLGTNDTVRIVNNTIVFQCSKDGYTTDHAYPRTTDPVAGIQTAITNATTNTITVNVGRGAGIGASFTATIDNGMVTGVTVTNPGAGYTTSYQPIITIDPPSPWKNLPLTGGQGSGATLDVVVGTGGSAIEYELANPGIGYSVGDVLSLNPVPYKVGVSTTPLTLTVKNRHQDKFAGWTVGQLLEMDPFDSLFNGFRKQFLITRTVGGVKNYFSVIAKKDSGIVLANNLLVYVNDVLQKPVVDYTFDQGTRITFNDAPRGGSKVRMYLYVASRDDYFDVDIDETIKPGDTLTIQPNLPTYGEPVPYDPNTGDKQHPFIDPSYPSQDDRIVYELISSDSVETQTYGGPGIATNGLGNIPRPVIWSKQQADTVIDGIPISKSRVYLEPEITPNTNIIAPVSKTDTKIYVRNIYPTFYAYDDIGQNLNNIRIVGLGSSAIEITSNTDANVGPGTITSGNSVGDATGETGVLNYEEIKRVTYSGDHGVIIGINTGKTGVGTHQLIFDLHPALNIQNEISRTGLNTGDFFVIENSIIGSGVTALGITTSNIVGTGTTWIDGVYQVADFTTTGVGASTLRVTCHVESLTGIDTTGLPAPISGATGRPNCGTYTWGTINVTRSSNSKSFSYYNSNGLAGIETSAYVSRLLGLA